MSSKLKASFTLFITIFTLAGFGILAFLVTGNQIIQFDKALLSFIQNLETPLLTTIMKFFSEIGAGSSIKILALISIIVLFFFFKHRSELILFTMVLIGSHYLFRVLKQLFQRARPDLHRLIEIGGYSFPSGHATNAITVYGILSFLLWRHIPTRWGRALLICFSTIIIFSIGFSRIYLGVHYPSDVIAGYFVGGFWLAITILTYQFVMEKK
ncbi:MAG: phosphatase PAP2 family protein [Paenisporosarcina sp.]